MTQKGGDLQWRRLQGIVAVTLDHFYPKRLCWEIHIAFLSLPLEHLISRWIQKRSCYDFEGGGNRNPGKRSAPKGRLEGLSSFKAPGQGVQSDKRLSVSPTDLPLARGAFLSAVTK